MRKITKTLCMLLIACMSTAVNAAVGDDYLTGWNDNSNGKTPYDAGWRGPAGNTITWGASNSNQVSWRTGIGSPVNNGDDPMLYTTLQDTKLNYHIGSLSEGKIYQLTGKIWRRNGGSGSAAFNFAVSSDILVTNENALLQYTYTANGNGVAGSFTSSKFAVPANFASELYLLWDVHVNSGNWDCAGIWGLELKELGDALTVTFNTNSGSMVQPQYLLKDAGEKVVKPADPIRSGYIFNGWFSDAACTTAYDFASPVTANIIIYAGWQDIKAELKTLVATASSLLENGTEKGQAYLNEAISAAKTVMDESDDIEIITEAFNSLTTAIVAYQDASLSSLLVGGTAINGFSTTIYEYNYSLDLSVVEIPEVTADVSSQCATVIVSPAYILPGNTTVTVTAGNGDSKTYTINFIYNYMAGWDADGEVTKSPFDAGWYTTDSNVTWADATAVVASTYQYRDNLGVGRAFIHPANNSVFSYPLKDLKAGKAYTFTCSSATMSGTRGTTFSVNTLQNGTGITLGQENKIAAQWGKSTTNYRFSFVAPDNGTYYLIWQTEEGGGERSLAFGFEVFETSISASNIATFSDDVLVGIQALKLEGNFTVENMAVLNSKLGANKVLTSVDLSNATVASEASDIFAALNPNTLKYFAAGASVPADWTNVVIGERATSIVLADGYPFGNVKKFTASTISYQRTFAKGWSTLCLPFSMDDTSELGTIEEFEEVKNETSTIAFKSVWNIEAGKPYLINMETEEERTFLSTDATVPVTVATEGIFNATFHELTGTDLDGKLILVDNGDTQKFETVQEEAAIAAFRAYISVVTPSLTGFTVEHVANGGIVDGQTDITARYLQNADFETSPIFTESNGTANGTQVNLGTELAQGYQIPGWNMALNSVWSRSATAKYGITFETIPAVLNAVNPPISDMNGKADGHVLMLSGGWTSEVILTQDVTLPAGIYELVYDVLNLASGKPLGVNYFGFVPNEGTPVYSTTLNYGGQWTTEKVTFTLKERTSGKISLGLKAVNKISTDNARLAVDNVKLLSNPVNNTTLAEAISSAKWILVPGCPGEAYLQNAIDVAQAIYDRGDATITEILRAVEDLEKAMALYSDATLSGLQVNGVTVAGFSPEVFAYTHIMAPEEEATVTATATGAEAGAKVTVSDINTATNTVTVSVTSGKGETTNSYTVTLYSDYMAGWDAGGDVTKSPYDAGWRTTDESVTWTATPGDASTPDKYQYRDNLGVGRVFIHPKNDAVFSYPVRNLKAGKMYEMTCISAKMSGEGTRTTTFSINTKEDGTGRTLASVTKEAAKWNSYTNYSLSFVTPDDGTYYVIWQTQATDNGDRSMAWNFKLIQAGEAIEVTFDSDGGTEVDTQYLAWGDKIIEPEVPVKDGYEFNGWWYDEDGFASKWNFEVGVEKSMLLQARWINVTALDLNFAENPFKVWTVSNGVNVKTSQAVEVMVVSITGQIIKRTSVAVGESFIALPAGMYIINGIKTIVK